MYAEASTQQTKPKIQNHLIIAIKVEISGRHIVNNFITGHHRNIIVG